MPTASERLKQVILKVERAKKHVSNLERELRTFFDTNPYKVGAKHDPQSRKLVYYILSTDEVPDCIPLIAGDAIQNMMSTLDHLAYQIVCSDTGDRPPKPWRIYFPIGDDAPEYESVKRRKMEGAHQDTFDAIDALTPYKGGNDLLWMLARLNNIEKHRLLLTVGSQAAGVNVSQYAARSLPSGTPADIRASIESLGLFIFPADKGFPLKQGFELLIGSVDEEPNPNQQFRFEVALDEPGIIEGKPILETLHQLTALVDGIVTALTPRLN